VVDGLTPQDPAGQPFDAVDESGAPLPPEEEKKGLFSSPIAKILGIVAAILVVLVICGVIAMLVFTFFIAEEAQDVMDDAASQAATETAPAGGSSEATGVVPVEPEPVSYSRIFTFRDIFDPYYSAPIICDTTGTVEGTSTTEGKLTADVSSGTLYLEAIVIENGEPTAVLLWEGTEYRLTEGQGIPGTPWLVLTINETSVVMLYGDQQVVLSIGQGTSR
jgi:hypothetical protein